MLTAEEACITFHVKMQMFECVCLCEQKDFMSVQVTDGRVKVSYDLGSGTASVTSNRRHNDGKWKSVTMSRTKKEGTHTQKTLNIHQHTFSRFFCDHSVSFP